LLTFGSFVLQQLRQKIKRISGPLPDRIDIHIGIPRVDYKKLSGHRLAEGSESIRARAQVARELQLKRGMHIGEIRQFCKLPEGGKRLMRAAMRNSIYLRELIIVFSCWRARLLILLGVKSFEVRTWQRRCTLRSCSKLMMSLSDREVRKTYSSILRRVMTSLFCLWPVSIRGPALRAIAPSRSIAVILPASFKFDAFLPTS
jgi:hypothetical protein